MSANENGSTSREGQPVKTLTQQTNAIIPFPDNCDKPNLIARLARAGHVVHECAEQSFTVVNPLWGMSRYCSDFAALQNFARIVGVKA